MYFLKKNKIIVSLKMLEKNINNLHS